MSDELVAIGGDLDPETLIAGYRRGLFPMPVTDARGRSVLGWWSPALRGILLPDAFHASRSLHRSARRFTVSVDAAFDDVVAGCADPSRPHGWIDAGIAAAYGRLANLGVAHSIEVWDHDGALVGGLYGVGIGGLFAAESKFHRRTDASKVAVGQLCAVLRGARGNRLIDVQWRTPHLASLGVVAVSRADYASRLPAVLGQTDVEWDRLGRSGRTIPALDD